MQIDTLTQGIDLANKETAMRQEQLEACMEALREANAHRDKLADDVLRLRAALKNVKFNLVGGKDELPQSKGALEYNTLNAVENIKQALASIPCDYVAAAQAEREFLKAALDYAEAKELIESEAKEYKRSLAVLRVVRNG